MRLVENWRRVVAISLSFWMQVAGLAVLIAPEVRYATTGADSNPVVAWWLGTMLLVAGLAGRLVQQSTSVWIEWARLIGVVAVIALLAMLLGTQLKVTPAHAGPPSEAETMKVAVPFIARKEGVRLNAYRDIVGVPTICFGSTRGVRLGMKKTYAQCLALLRSEVSEYRNGVYRYYTPATIYDRLTPKRDAAYTSLAFNCGIRAIGRSTAVRRLNGGDIAGGCTAIGWWNKAGGRVIRGLVLRRADEIKLCRAGLQ